MLLFIRSAVFLVLSVVQYIAYYEMITAYLQDYIGRLGVMLCIVLTYMFRLDILAAAVGCWGIWKIWHAPLLVAIFITAAFEVLSLIVNHWTAPSPRTFYDRIMSRKRKTP